MKILTLITLLCFVMVTAFAQDPLKALPENYKLQFENDYVKVTRVHYPANAKLAAHAHTATASAYVYLNDSDPVIFKHIGAQYGAIKRPATKAGSFRLYKAVQEIHEVENPSNTPSDFLRVEFKTEPVNDKSLYGRYFREAYPEGENFQKVQFENEQVRITRLVCAAGKTLDVNTRANEPGLLIALTPAMFKASKVKGKSSSLKLEMGQSTWVAANQAQQLMNAGQSPIELLRFDFKTAPLSKAELEKKKPHDHSKN
ncbi:MAG: hypothetical protein AB1757_27405 [Acidobacteriota bacterium]